MSIFRYYIVDLHDGCVKGTDDNQTALDMSHSEDHFVIDSKTGNWLVNNKDQEIKYYGD